MHVLTDNPLMDFSKTLFKKPAAIYLVDEPNDVTKSTSFETVINKLCNRDLYRTIASTSPKIEPSLIDLIIDQDLMRYNTKTRNILDKVGLLSKLQTIRRSEPILAFDRSIIAIFSESLTDKYNTPKPKNTKSLEINSCDNKMHDRVEKEKKVGSDINDELSRTYHRDVATSDGCDSDSGVSTISSSSATTTNFSGDNVGEDNNAESAITTTKFSGDNVGEDNNAESATTTTKCSGDNVGEDNTSSATTTTNFSGDNVGEDNNDEATSAISPVFIKEVDVMSMEVHYDGHDILDLASTLNSRPWDMQPTQLPLMNLEMFWQNRSQYHRLGNFGQEDFKQMQCNKCGFQFPVPN